MKPGLEVGQMVMIQAKVTPEMFAQFEGQVVHRAYSTVSMVYHMEWASRKIILPFLEEDEEGMGGAVSVKHIAPTPEGATVTVTATLTQIKDNIIKTDVKVNNGDILVGVGEVKQVIVPKVKIAKWLHTESI